MFVGYVTLGCDNVHVHACTCVTIKTFMFDVHSAFKVSILHILSIDVSWYD